MGASVRCIFLAIAAFSVHFAAAADERDEALTVFAAASLTDSLQKISAAYTEETGVPVRLSFAASSALARQIEAGARADVFFSADQEWMDYLEEKQLIRKPSRTELLGNRLALIAPHDSTLKLELVPKAPLLAALGGGRRIAMGDPDSVPAGRYAKDALTSLGLWEAVESRLARAENVRVALSYVARGEAPLGIVYATDVAVEPRVRIIDLFPQNSHAPITYPVAATSTAGSAATAYLAYLRGPAAGKVFAEAGFRVLAPASRASAGP